MNLHAQRTFWLIVAIVPVIALIVNLALPVPLVSAERAALPLAFCIGLGVANAMMVERKLRQLHPPSQRPKGLTSR